MKLEFYLDPVQIWLALTLHPLGLATKKLHLFSILTLSTSTHSSTSILSRARGYCQSLKGLLTKLDASPWRWFHSTLFLLNGLTIAQDYEWVLRLLTGLGQRHDLVLPTRLLIRDQILKSHENATLRNNPSILWPLAIHKVMSKYCLITHGCWQRLMPQNFLAETI